MFWSTAVRNTGTAAAALQVSLQNTTSNGRINWNYRNQTNENHCPVSLLGAESVKLSAGDVETGA